MLDWNVTNLRGSLFYLFVCLLIWSNKKKMICASQPSFSNVGFLHHINVYLCLIDLLEHLIYASSFPDLARFGVIQWYQEARNHQYAIFPAKGVIHKRHYHNFPIFCPLPSLVISVMPWKSPQIIMFFTLSLTFWGDVINGWLLDII